MKILYVVSRPIEINTSASIRNRATIAGLLEQGHEVDVFTSEPDTNHPAYDGNMKIAGIKTTYVKINGIQSLARIGRKHRFLSSLKKALFNLAKKAEVYDNLKGITNYTKLIDLGKENYDLIISSSDPKSSHLFVYKLISEQQFSGKWAQIWGDPFLNDITLSSSINKKKVYAEEKKLLGRADAVFYVSKPTMDQQMATYPEFKEKMFSIPIPYESKDFEYNELKVQSNKKIKLAYCGDYKSTTRNILPLYNAVYNSDGRFDLTICGSSDLSLESNDRVHVFGRKPYDYVKEVERGCDILVHLSNLNGSQIPGKIYQYSSTSKPILFILDGDEKTLIDQFSKYNRYVFTENKSEAILASLSDMINSSVKYSPVDAFYKANVANMLIKYIWPELN